MNKKELYKHLERLQLSLSDKKIPCMIEAFKVFLPLTEEIKSGAIDELLRDSNGGVEQRIRLRDKISKIIDEEKNLKFRKIIAESEQIDDNLRQITVLCKSEDYCIEFLSEIETKLENFLDSYEEHTRSYSPSTCLSLSLHSSELNTAINSTNQILQNVLIIQTHNATDDNMQRIDLYLSNVTSLKEFAKKLDAISEIYNQILCLYGQSELDNPIIMEHLESGSLWIKIAGHTLTMTILVSIFTTSTKYYQEHLTTDGQIKQLPTSIEAINGLLKITEKLDKDGIDTSKIKDKIQSSTIKIAKKLDALLSDQPIVEINNVKHDIGHSLSEKLIGQSKNKQIGNSEISNKLEDKSK